MMPKGFELTHSGVTWVSLGVGPKKGYNIWPVEEYLARTNHGPRVVERIMRLNPNGKEESFLPRGVHPKRISKRRMKRRMENE